jgi:hypothetical protein
VKRAGIILLFLLSAIPLTFSQAFRIDVDNKPLSRVLNMLGVEISFDVKALSAYSVSLSESFESREDALRRLLENKPFLVEKIGNVYVIVPAGNNETADRIATSAKKQVAFKGRVIDESTREALEYTTVSLLHPGGEPLLVGITTGEGRFSFETTLRPEKLKISCLGYETLLIDMRYRQGELGVFTLKEKAIPLGETVVTADWDKPNRIIYSVSPQMYNGVDNAMELLNRIPGVRFDAYARAIVVNNRTNVLLLVDGIQYPQAYLWHLSPHRIHAVEVMQASSGRFVSDDYVAIVNFMLNKNYTGYDMNVSDISSLNMSESNGYSRRTEDRPAVGITYATRKWNFFGTYAYEREKRNLFSSKELAYGNSLLTSVASEHPTNLYEAGNNTLSGGVNYRITPRHLAGVQGDYAWGNVYTRQAYTLRRTDLTTNHGRILTNTTEDRTKVHTFAGSAFYQGQVSDRLHLHGNFSYNYYYNLIENEYRQGETANYRYENFYNEYKNQTVLNIEGKYVLSDKLSAEAGYSNIRRRYASTSDKGMGFLDYSEQRNKAYTYLSYNPSDKASLKAGAAVERINTRNRETPDSYIRLLPFFQATYKINHRAHILAGYAANQSYPSLYQLSPMSVVIDTFLTQIGNPALRSATRRQVFAELTLWGQWRIIPQFNFLRHGIGEVYEIKEYKLYRTFDNINTQEYSVQAAYDRMLGYFRLKNAVTLYHSEALHQNVRNSLNGWLLLSEVNWYHPGVAFGVQLGYYRDMKKNILWQGYQMSGKDYWSISVQKELWRERISVGLSYIPPVAFGVRYNRVKEMDTPLYGEKTTLRLDSYNQMLLLKISVRFERGSAKPAGKPSITGNEEREK